MTELSHPCYIWFDGELVPWEKATIHITAMEWSGVSSVFEGIKAYRNEDLGRAYVFRLDAHMARFEDSMRLMRLGPQFSTQALTEELLKLLRANETTGDTYIRPYAFFGEGKWFGSMADTPTHLLITTRSFETRLGTDRKLKACVSSWTRIMDNAMPPRVKAVANYQNSRLAATEANLNGFDTCILLNERHKVAEAPGACLMIIRDGVVITPPVTSGILESITRTTLIQLLRDELDVQVIEREMDRTELYLADEAFLCGTGAEVAPIISVDHYPVGDEDIGEITRELSTLYHDIVRGVTSDYAGWRTLV